MSDPKHVPLQGRIDAFGHEAEAAGHRLAHDPRVVSAGTWLTRVWGLVFIGVGVWFFGKVTLGLDMPDLDWNLVWPIGLMFVGAVIVVGTLGRSSRR